LQKVWVVQVVINGRPFGPNLALERDGSWWLPEKGSEAWGVTTKAKGDATTTRYRGLTFVPVDAFATNSVQFDEHSLTLNITFDASAFGGSGNRRLSGASDFVPPTQQALGGFVNYDLLLTSISQRGVQNSTDVGTEIELGAFSSLGSMVGSFKVLRVPANGTQLRPPPVVREVTTYRTDWPENMWTLEVGDTTGKSGMWGQPVLFGGINFRTNFLTRPGFVSYPQPAFSGAAVVPSTATVFIDSVRRANLGLAPGPFGVSNIPVVSGNNEVSLVVRDALGRETITRQQFYASLDLLRPGLHDFAVEAGLVRQNFGYRSFDYKQLIIVGQSRYGWSDKLTTEARFEQFGRGTTLGFGAIVLLPIAAVATVAVAGSHSEGRSGSLILGGIEKQARNWSAGIRGQWTSAGFSQLGSDQVRLNARQKYTAYANTKLGNDAEYGSLGIAYADAGRGATDGGKTVTATWIKSLPRGALFHLTALYADQPKRGIQLSALLSYPLGPRTSSSAELSRSSSGAISEVISASTSLNNVGETAWRTRISSYQLPGGSSNATGDATLLWRAPTFDANAGLSVSQTAQGGRLAISGAVGIADGVGFMSHSVYDGFGVIRTPGMTGIPIMASGRVIAISDSNGVAIVPRVVPYQENTFRVDLKRLPLNIDTDDDKVVLVPAFRSAALGEIKLFRTVSALMIVTTADGEPIPLGTDANLVGSKERFVVGRSGRLFLSRLQPKNEVVVNLDSGDCKFSLDIPEVQFAPSVDGNRRLQLGTQICR